MMELPTNSGAVLDKGFKTPTTGSLKSWDRRVRPRLVFRNGTPLASRVVHRVTGHFSICLCNLGFFQAIQGGVSAPSFCAFIHRVAFKRCPGIGFFSRADQENGVFCNVEPRTRLRLVFHHETGLILRCAGKVWNPFQTKQRNRPSCRDQEGRRGSDEVVPGTSVFASRT